MRRSSSRRPWMGAKSPSTSTTAEWRDRLVGEVASEFDIPLLDLHATFADHYARNQQRFEFAYGWHWNVLANRLVGEAIARVLLRDPGLWAGSVQRGADAARPPQG